MKFIKSTSAAAFAVLTLFSGATSHASTVATFEDLALPPAINSVTGLQYTNATNSLIYQGVTWDAGFSVVGDEYRVSAPSGPVFGLPHSGHYFVTNQGGQSGLTISTEKILTGAWLGRNEYYGFGAGGADQVSIFALSGTTELGSVVFDLPENMSGQAEPLSFVNTQVFGAMKGITGYRIDRRELGVLSGHWVADDFQFRSVSDVPEPATYSLLMAGLACLFACKRRKVMNG